MADGRKRSSSPESSRVPADRPGRSSAIRLVRRRTARHGDASRSRTTRSVTSRRGRLLARDDDGRRGGVGRGPSTAGSPRSPSASATAPVARVESFPEACSRVARLPRSGPPSRSATRRSGTRRQAEPDARPGAARHRRRRIAQPPPGVERSRVHVDRAPRRDAGVPHRTERGPGRVTQSHARRGHHRCDQRRAASVRAVPVRPARREAQPAAVRRASGRC